MASLFDDKLVIVDIDESYLFGSALEGGLEMAAAAGSCCSCTSTCCTSTCSSCAVV